MKAWILAVAVFATPLLASAVERSNTPPGTTARDQQEVLTWLELQSSGRAASTNLQSATPAERDRAYQRYLKSYTHEIPEYLLDDKDFNTGSK
ncbi:DUF3613 domain-containing protein [Pseudomonas sp. CAN2814]|jgi:hypothetical protein|uniref:DUF3613 domain-containing protein n=1 Tax=Pseudomonas sp. CAN1 TaxID=3046726 RepID=UPI0026493287|nr:DUF3613 domain-containing protein [Pseudomonas sp. CAN1]MDN6859355.1 DUF3613 domain-containing protein [Pseudomonas sp. CAN1]